MSALRTASSTFLSVCAPSGIIGNIIVLLAFHRQEQTDDCSHIFFKHLAIVDLIMCTGGLVTGLGIMLTGGFQYCQGGLIFIALFYGLSSGTVCLMTLDRYIYISMPLRYYCKMSTKRARLLLIGIWCISVVNILPVVSGVAFHRKPGPFYRLDIKNCVLPKIINIPYFLWLEGTFLAFLAATVYFNIRLLSYARQQSRKIEASTLPTGSEFHADESFNSTIGNQTLATGKCTGTHQIHRIIFLRQRATVRLTTVFLRIRQKKYVKIIFFIVFIHCLCNLPYFLFVTLEIICGSSFEYQKIKFAYSLYLLNYLNSVLNPVIYTSLNKRLRESVKRMLYSVRCRSS